MQTVIYEESSSYTGPRPVRSGVAWSAIFGGALAATAITLILLALGSGLGLSSVTPWFDNALTVTEVTIVTAIWLVIMQWISSGVGGYLTGRLRTRWLNTHNDEIFFRDTAHGFLAWALATFIVALFVMMATGFTLKTGAEATALHEGMRGAQTRADRSRPSSPLDPMGYYVDRLFRAETITSSTAAMPADNEAAPESNVMSAMGANMGMAPMADTRPAYNDARAEARRILMQNAGEEGVSDEDRAYLAQLVRTRSGVTQDAAERRVNDVLAQEKDDEMKAREAADKARKAGITLSLVTFLSMLIGAFIASAAAALGGRHRDIYEVMSLDETTIR